jgi:hypothetical protein
MKSKEEENRLLYTVNVCISRNDWKKIYIDIFETKLTLSSLLVLEVYLVRKPTSCYFEHENCPDFGFDWSSGELGVPENPTEEGPCGLKMTNVSARKAIRSGFLVRISGSLKMNKQFSN